MKKLSVEDLTDEDVLKEFVKRFDLRCRCFDLLV